jgi:hypothetical protein
MEHPAGKTFSEAVRRSGTPSVIQEVVCSDCSDDDDLLEVAAMLSEMDIDSDGIITEAEARCWIEMHCPEEDVDQVAEWDIQSGYCRSKDCGKRFSILPLLSFSLQPLNLAHSAGLIIYPCVEMQWIRVILYACMLQ